MQTVGEQFKEARKGEGVSLREASEAIKIRSDYLEYIEQNNFDFELPEIYKRGFIKIYATYLKLDVQNILTTYDAEILSYSRSNKKNGSELFGIMEPSNKTSERLLGKISSTPASAEDTEEEITPEEETDKTFYIKVGLVIAGVLTFLVVIVGLLVAILGSSDEAPSVETASSSSSVTTDTESTTEASTVQEETVSLIASGTVYVLVKQNDNNKELVRKTMEAGETLTFTKVGSADILFTAGENLVIVDPTGERLKPEGTGTAKISIP